MEMYTLVRAGHRPPGAMPIGREHHAKRRGSPVLDTALGVLARPTQPVPPGDGLLKIPG